MEYYRGLLFVRLTGRLSNSDYLKTLDEVVEKIGIRYIILNMNKIESVSLECINHIKKYNNKLLKKKKYLLICDSNSRRRRLFKNIISNIDSELDAFSLI